jgi:uncharacterized protein DUF669
MTQSTFGALMDQAAKSGATFEVLEAGVYIAKIIESEYKTSANGKPQIKTRWEVTHGPKAGFKGLWNYFTLTTDNPNALAIFYRQMTALGITSDFLQSLANVDPETAMKHISGALLGQAAQVKVKVDAEYNNNKIERINPIPPEAAQFVNTPTADPFAAAAAPAPTAQAVPSSHPTQTAPVPDGPAAPPPPF